jgi:hypothetical protein
MADGTSGPGPENREKIEMIPNREVRVVPFDWQHPRDENDEYIPLFPHESLEEFAEFEDEKDEEVLKQDYEEWREMMMPDFSTYDKDKLGIAAYETYTDGTPISPVFPQTPEGRFQLAKFCAENRTLIEGFSSKNIPAKNGDMVEWAHLLYGNKPLIDLQSGKVLDLDQEIIS